jgi:hypothetical protein
MWIAYSVYPHGMHMQDKYSDGRLSRGGSLSSFAENPFVVVPFSCLNHTNPFHHCSNRSISPLLIRTSKDCHAFRIMSSPSKERKENSRNKETRKKLGRDPRMSHILLFLPTLFSSSALFSRTFPSEIPLPLLCRIQSYLLC